ncbi:MAG: beta-galactosidase [Candidatus Hydrogenedentes bacterium]|nr:beta-galactosidase [Candidatus Hydrogenedentota bacterium]
MTRLRLWHVAFVCIPVVASAVWAQTNPSPTPQRMWFTQTGNVNDRHVTLSVRVESEYTLPTPIRLECDFESPEPVDDVRVALKATDSEGVAAYESEIVTDLEQGTSPCVFTWDTAGLKDGVYNLEIVAERTSMTRLATLTMTAEVLSEGVVQASLAKAEAATLAMTRTLERLVAEGKPSLYGTVRTAIASDALPKARAAFAEGDWRRAYTSAVAVYGMTQNLALELAFRGCMGAPAAGYAPADLSKLEIRNGDFYAGDRVVYLLGTYGSDDLAETMPVLHRYGLNLGVDVVGPDETLTGTEVSTSFQAPLDRVFEAAKANNISVAVELAPNLAPAWVLEKWPELTERGGGSFPYDVTLPQARNLIEAHTRAVAGYVANKPMLNSLILTANPEFRMEGNEVREKFIASVREMYGDHNKMNRLWRTRYLNFDEITLDWALQRPPYQYDLQMFHRRLGTELLQWMAGLAKTAAPGAPVQVACSDHVFQLGEAVAGIDREALSHSMDIQGCTTLSPPIAGQVAESIGEHGMYYALLHSMNPGAPVFDSACGLHMKSISDPSGYLRALVWDAVISGADAVALPLQQSGDSQRAILDDPRAMNGLATASLDVNRLSSAVAAFQSAPAEVAILWSTSSQIYKQGEPFTESARIAYLGCSTFGYAVRFITEDQCARGELEGIRVLVIPNVLALTDEAFKAVDKYIESGGVTIRTGEPIPYNPHGHTRTDTLTTSPRTVYVRGSITPKSYMHAMDSANDMLGETQFPRAINSNGYPLEGVKTRLCMIEGALHLYLVNLREIPVDVTLQGGYSTGRDLVSGGPVAFPGTVAPLSPMLIRLDEPKAHVAEEASTPTERTVPSAAIEPVVQEPEKKSPRTRAKAAAEDK